MADPDTFAKSATDADGATFVVTSPQHTFAAGYSLPRTPHSALLAPRDPPSPKHHPKLPDTLWVLDPMTRKLKVPTKLIVPTAATASIGSTPSLCLAFLENRCRHTWCRQAHVPMHVVQKLRQDAQCAPTCCFAHKAPQEPVCLRARFEKLEVVFPGGTRVLIDATNVAVTVGLQRHLAQVVLPSKQGPVLDVPSRMVCRLHLASRCRYLEDCNNLHLCREHDGLRKALADCGHPAPTTPQTQPQSQSQSQPRNSSPGQPPAYMPPANATPPMGASRGSPPPFGASSSLPPSALSNSAASIASPAARHTAALQAVVPGAQQAVVGGRVYNVTTLRYGAVSDGEMATLVDAQRTLFGKNQFDVVDIPPPPPAGAPPPYGVTAASLEAACSNTAMVSALGGQGSPPRSSAWADIARRGSRPRDSSSSSGKDEDAPRKAKADDGGPFDEGLVAGILEDADDDSPRAPAADKAGDAWSLPTAFSHGAGDHPLLKL